MMQEIRGQLMGNPQCTRVLANDMACRLARMIGSACRSRSLSSWTKKMILDRELPLPWLAGRFCASGTTIRFRPGDREVLDWLPGTMLGRVRNLREFPGLLAFDKWTCNADGRQVVFHKKLLERKYAEDFIDLDTASMRVSGVSPTLRCAECTAQ